MQHACMAARMEVLPVQPCEWEPCPSGMLYTPSPLHMHSSPSTPPPVSGSVSLPCPQVVNASRATAAASGGWWRYPPKGFLCMQSGAGNNWAHGFHGYGPRVHDETLDLVRREVGGGQMGGMS